MNKEEITNLLGGYNCGGCGYDSCEDLAQAILDGEATPDYCGPNSSENTDKLNELLNKTNK